MNDNVKWYIEAITHELERLLDTRFTGNIEFRVNFKDVSIANQNITLSKSVKRPTEKFLDN